MQQIQQYILPSDGKICDVSLARFQLTPPQFNYFQRKFIKSILHVSQLLDYMHVDNQQTLYLHMGYSV